MTNLNYSNLPPEAQKAIQKLTGLSHQELENKLLSDLNTSGIKKAQPPGKPLKVSLKTMLAFLIIIFACWGVIALVLYTCAR